MSLPIIAKIVIVDAGAAVISGATAIAAEPAPSEAVLIAVITSLTTLVIAVITLAFTAFNIRFTARTAAEVKAVGKAVNGVTSHLVAATDRAAKAEGVAEGIAIERADPQSPIDAIPAGDGATRIVEAIEAAAARPTEIAQAPTTPPIRVKTDKAPKP